MRGKGLRGRSWAPPLALAAAATLGGLGAVETAFAAPAPIDAFRLVAAADTDSVVVARPDTDTVVVAEPDTLTIPDPDSAAVADSVAIGDSVAVADSAGLAIADSAGFVAADSAGLAISDSAALAATGDTIDGEPEGPPFPSEDEIFRQLAAEEGFHVVEYRAREVGLDIDEETIELDGEAQTTYQQASISADQITYWADLKYVQANAVENSTVLSGEGRDAVSDSVLYYDVSNTKGTMMDAQTQFAERGAEWFVRGTTTPRGSRHVFVEAGNFTSCEIEHPHYYFRAGQIKVVSNDIIVAWPVTLYVHDVPVAWLPFFAQDIREERRSGFLPPRFGFNDVVSSSSNVRRSITDFGYYFALNDYMDAQTTVDWFSGRFTRASGAFRYRSMKKFFRGSVLGSYSFGDERTFQLRMQHQHDLTPVTNIRVSANYITNTRVFERQTFDPTLQTQRIASDFGIQHRFPFASVNLSGSRRQDLGAQDGSVDLTLPNLRMTFSPVTLFKAPASRRGPFNNIVVTGGFAASRLNLSRKMRDGTNTQRASANSSVRIGSFGVSGGSNYTRNSVVPFEQPADSTADQGSRSTTRLDYRAQADYQVDLIGSTTVRPTVSVDASSFRSRDTQDGFVASPMRLRVGATVATDVYGFLPGFGPFTRIRHKISPRLTYDYSPAIQVSDSLLSIRGFPVSNSRPENRLRLTFNQTFEAKLSDAVQLDPEAQALLEGRSLDSLYADSLEAGRGADTMADLGGADAAPAAGDSAATDSMAAISPDSSGGADGRDDVPEVRDRRLLANPEPPRRRQQRRNVVLLGINSSAIDFDFERENEPVLTTDRWSHRVNSDLLKGLSINMSLDLFEGRGEERTFAPILSSFTGSFTFSSASGLGGLLGLGGGGSRKQNDPRNRLRDAADSRYRLQSFDENPDPLDPGLRSGGPWTLALTYSLQRGREGESARDRQSLNAVLSLNPTPNWSLAWRTSYNISEGKFGEHLITLDRALHRWMATFMFSRSPNGNFIFQMSVNLRDVPDLKVDYDQQTLDR